VKRAIENLFTLNAKYKHFKDTFPLKKHVFFFFFFGVSLHGNGLNRFQFGIGQVTTSL
jgi:hypothetical protein